MQIHLTSLSRVFPSSQYMDIHILVSSSGTLLHLHYVLTDPRSVIRSATSDIGQNRPSRSSD